MSHNRSLVAAITLFLAASAIIGGVIYLSGIASCAGQQTIEIGHMRVAGCP